MCGIKGGKRRPHLWVSQVYFNLFWGEIYFLGVFSPQQENELGGKGVNAASLSDFV